MDCFGDYLFSLRKELRCSRKKLCRGLCSEAMLSEIEHGRRNAGKMLRDRLIGRLGVSGDEYESFLNYDDYNDYLLQQKVVYAFDERNVEELEKMLQIHWHTYRLDAVEQALASVQQDNRSGRWVKKDGIGEIIRYQYYLIMTAEWMKLSGKPTEERKEVLERAVRLTMPNLEGKEFQNNAYSLLELNTLLEWNLCDRENDLSFLITYVENSKWEKMSAAKLLPKILYYQVKREIEKKENSAEELEKLLYQCERGIEWNRQTRRFYYFIDLLESKEKILLQMQSKVEKGSSKEKEIIQRLRELSEWKSAVLRAEQLFHISLKRENDAYLYYMQDAFYIGDVIRKRRKMLGLKRTELCEGICSLDTLRRLENGQKNTQVAIIKELCEALRLPTEPEKTDIISTNPLVHRLEIQLRRGILNNSHQENLEIIEKMKSELNMEHALNQQFILLKESTELYELNRIGKTDYEASLMKALRYTLPANVPVQPEGEEWYLTNIEKMCMYLAAKINSMEKAWPLMQGINLILSQFKTDTTQKNHIRQYELFMIYLAELERKRQNRERSMRLALNVGHCCMSVGRWSMLSLAMYTLIRNRHKELLIENRKPADRTLLQDIKYCRVFSVINYDTVNESNLSRIISSLEDSINPSY